jgi:hypothetical protein
MTTLMIEDLPRNDELTVEEMKTIEGGFLLHSSAISEVMKNFGEALNTAARGG